MNEVRNSGGLATGVVMNSRVDCRAKEPNNCSYHHPKGNNEGGW